MIKRSIIPRVNQTTTGNPACGLVGRIRQQRCRARRTWPASSRTAPAPCPAAADAPSEYMYSLRRDEMRGK
eukprot:3865105-Rhodomonas_salina.2